MRCTGNEQDVERKLAAIPGLSRAALIERWTEAYGRPPPKGLSRRLLEYAAAYHVQVKAYGGLSPAMLRALRRYAEPRRDDAQTAPPIARRAKLAPGSRLIREWHGRTYTVDVLNSGFSCDGRRYRSLSEIARVITGTRWSGPKFFGL